MADFPFVIQAVIKGKVEGQDYRNVLHFGTAAEVNDANYTAVITPFINALMEVYKDELMPLVRSTNSIDIVTGQRLWPTLSDKAETDDHAAVGSGSGFVLPSFNSVKIDVKTGGGGKKHRGSMKLFPPLESQTDGSFLSPAGLLAYTGFTDALAALFLGAGGSSAFKLGVLSRAMVAGGSSIGDAFKAATTLIPNRTVGVVRRRKQGVGS